jgi:FlaA1/EpsC-like NDP-sugar epimerase
MGKPVKIVDLAQNMIKLYAPRHRNIPVVFTGLRKGEKLYEEILTENESLSKTLFDKLFVSDEKQMILSGEDLEKLIGQVKEVSDSFDRKRILELIQHYVPEYPGRHHPDDH